MKGLQGAMYYLNENEADFNQKSIINLIKQDLIMIIIIIIIKLPTNNENINLMINNEDDGDDDFQLPKPGDKNNFNIHKTC